MPNGSTENGDPFRHYVMKALERLEQFAERSDRRWEGQEKRWAEQEKRWAEHEKRWAEQEKRWEEQAEARKAAEAQRRKDRREDLADRERVYLVLQSVSNSVFETNTLIRKMGTEVLGMFKPVLSSLLQIERDLRRRPTNGSNGRG